MALTATSAEPLPALTQDVVGRMQELGLESDSVGGATVAALVGAGRQQLPREPQLSDMTPLRLSQVEHTPERREEKVAQAVASFTERLGELTSDADGLDLLALLEQAGALDVPDIVVVSSGVSTVDPLDFRQLGWNRGVRSIVDELADRHLLPRHLEGKNVTFVGLGSTAGDQPRLAGPEQDWVEQLWVSVCRRAGAAECRLAAEVPLASEPAAARAVPVVPVPTIDTGTGVEVRPAGACRRVVRLPGQLLFDGDSARLRLEADPVLREIVRDVASGASVAEVAGHAADVGAGDGLVLSRQRADAVVQRLLDLGVDRTAIEEVVGYGDSRPVEPDLRPDGSVDEELAAKNRRVEITTAHTQCDQPENGENHD